MYTAIAFFLAVSHAMASTYICNTHSDCPDIITLAPGQSLECYGTGACQKKTITHEGTGVDPYSINCYGKNSCSMAKIKLTANTAIQCLGSDSCHEMRIQSDIGRIYVGGQGAFASVVDGYRVREYIVAGENGIDGVTSSLASSNAFLAQQSGAHSTFHSKGKDLTATFSGSEASKLTYFYCEDGSTCNITCNDCSNGYFIATGSDTKLNVNCVYKSKSCSGLKIAVVSNGQVRVTGDGKEDYTNWTGPTRRLSMAKTSLLLEKRSRDVRKLSSTHCESFKECANMVFDSSERTLHCEGAKSCRGMELSQSLGVRYLYGSGFKSARSSIVSSYTVEGSGAFSFAKAEITAIDASFGGFKSGMEATIRAMGDILNVSAEGTLSLKDATIVCEQGESCHINCTGFRSCEGARLECRTQGSCTQTCDAYSGCAIVV